MFLGQSRHYYPIRFELNLKNRGDCLGFLFVAPFVGLAFLRKSNGRAKRPPDVPLGTALSRPELSRNKNRPPCGGLSLFWRLL